MKRVHYELLLIATFLFAFIWSGWNPADRFTWYLEVFPAAIGAAAVFLLRKSFPLSTLTLWCIWVHCLILLIGGHYTYAEVPLFNWIRDAAGLSRNHYDRIGHFAQGFVPAVITREVLLRTTTIRGEKLLFMLAVSVAVAISGVYEIFEAVVSIVTARFTGEGATAFLGTQGDPWDTQEDIACALLGAVISQITLRVPLWKSIKTLEASEDAHTVVTG